MSQFSNMFTVIMMMQTTTTMTTTCSHGTHVGASANVKLLVVAAAAAIAHIIIKIVELQLAGNKL